MGDYFSRALFDYVFDEYRLFIDEANHIYYRLRESRIRARVDGLDNYEDRYTWTGQGIEDIPEVLSSGHQLVGRPITKEHYRYYWVNLGRRLSAGEETTIKTRQKFYDKGRCMQPIFFRIIRTNTEQLSLAVGFKNKKERVFEKLVTDALHTDNIISSNKTIIYEGDPGIKWVIDKPKHDRAYFIKWEWAK